MGKQSAPRLARFLPQVAVATLVVAVFPVVAVWALAASGLIGSALVLVLLGTILSLALAWAGRAFWETRPGSGDLLFGELMIWGWLRRWRTERRLASAVDLFGMTGMRQPLRVGRRVGTIDLEHQVEQLEKLANALEARDPYTHGHSRRVARHASMIAKRMGLSRDEVARIRTAAAVHDVGKLDTPKEILNKPGRLSDEEFEVIKQHALRGAQLVHRLGDEELAWIVVHHHERLDGGGYPVGLSGTRIPLGARIIAVADTFDAITSKRAYRGAKPHKQALDILNKEAGRQLDPEVVRAFCSYYSGFRPVAVWAVATSLPQRLLLPIVGEIPVAGGAASAAKVMAATAATAAVGSAALGASIALPNHDPMSLRAAAERALASTELGRAGSIESDFPRSTPEPGSSSPSGARPGGTAIESRTTPPGSPSRGRADDPGAGFPPSTGADSDDSGASAGGGSDPGAVADPSGGQGGDSSPASVAEPDSAPVAEPVSTPVAEPGSGKADPSPDLGSDPTPGEVSDTSPGKGSDPGASPGGGSGLGSDHGGGSGSNEVPGSSGSQGGGPGSSSRGPGPGSTGTSSGGPSASHGGGSGSSNAGGQGRNLGESSVVEPSDDEGSGSGSSNSGGQGSGKRSA